MSAETDAAVRFLRSITARKGVEPTFEDDQARFDSKQLRVLRREVQRQALMVRKPDAPALPDPMVLDGAFQLLLARKSSK